MESSIEKQETNDASIANTYLSGDSWEATLAIKTAFDEGLAADYGKRTIDYI
ncbi:MAG: hypothetical protein AAGJ93_06230 [Bacteroidota bacterium]